MTDLSPLRRKIGAPRTAGEAPPPLDASRIWRRALVHGLMRSIGLDLVVDEVEIEEIESDQVAALTAPDSLNLYLDGPNGFGVAIFASEVAMPMIEMQTLGRVLKRRAEPRAMTLTDAALVADPLDQVLATQEKLAETLKGEPLSAGFRYADMIADPRQIPLSLGDGRHDHVRLSLKAGAEAMRIGAVHLVLPRPVVATEAAPASRDDWDARLNERLMGSEVAVVAELARLTLDVERVQALTVGELLTLPRRTLGTVRLITATGTALGNARLGKSDGRKAVRIEEPGPMTFAEEVPLAADWPEGLPPPEED